MRGTRTIEQLRLKKSEKAALIKHLRGQLSGRELQRKLGLTSTRYYGICNAILKEAIAKGQVVPEELLNI